MGGRRRAVPRQLLSRNSGAGYLDLETKLTDQLGIGASVRVEDSSEFARQIDWKVSLRYEITPQVALRATANTGFRAPTPGQINTLDVTTTADARSEEHTSELQSLMRSAYAVFRLKKKKSHNTYLTTPS